MQSPSLVLVFAQSGRFIAESAARAGYTVRVADCFGDIDTRQVSQNWLRLPPLADLTAEQLLSTLLTLSDNQPCWLISGTGIERFYPLLSTLPPHIQFAGNPVESFAMLRQPKSFFSLLKRLELPFPKVTYSEPTRPYLLKDMAGSGGYSIQTSSTKHLSPSQYYQHHVEGKSYSVCFLADGQKAEILAWNRQYHREDDFTLIKLQQPAYPPAECQPLISDAVSKLTESCNLYGFNSLDYLVDLQGNVFILELNPRISASAELLPDADVFAWHLAACSGHLPQLEPPAQTSVRMLHYVFSQSLVEIVENAHWPEACHDLPQSGTTIEAGMPICTLIVNAESESECQKLLNQNILTAQQNCHSQA